MSPELNSPRNNKFFSYKVKALKFNPFLYKLVSDGIVTHNRLAEIWGVSENVVYNMLEGRTRVKPEHISLLFREIRDPSILDYFIEGTDFLLIERPESDCPESSILIHNLSVIASLGKFSDTLKDALADRHLDSCEKEVLSKCLDEVIKKLSAMYAILNTQNKQQEEKP